jgi:bifunctional non-homologous end joining protein LigD
VIRRAKSSAEGKQDGPRSEAAASVAGLNRTFHVATVKVRRELPAFVAPMQSKTIVELPAGDDWVYEVKRGGERTIAVKNGGQVKLYREDGAGFECPFIVEFLRRMPARAAVIDGEIIYVTPEPGHRQMRFFAWDLLHLNGYDMTMQSLEERKHRLCTLTLDGEVLFSPSLGCEPAQLVAEVSRLSLDGVIAKRKGSIYEPGKCTGSWLSLPLRRAV